MHTMNSIVLIVVVVVIHFFLSLRSIITIEQSSLLSVVMVMNKKKLKQMLYCSVTEAILTYALVTDHLHFSFPSLKS